MKSFATVIKYSFLILFFLVAVIPFIWLIVSSFRPNSQLFTNPFSLPFTVSFDNYKVVFQRHPMFRYFLNSVTIAFISTSLSVIVAILASYGLQNKFRLQPIVTVFLTCGIFIPTNAFMVPYYNMLNMFNLYDNVIGIALAYCGMNLPLSIIIIKGYMDTIPGEIVESALIDGAASFRILEVIIAPMCIPGIVTDCIFLILNSWNELLYANLLSQSEFSRTIQVSIRFFITTFEANYAYAFAGMVVSIVPTILIYAFLTDKIIDGMTAGAIKA